MWGRQSCLQAAFQAAVDRNRPLTQWPHIFFGFLSRRLGATKTREIRLETGGRPKAVGASGRSQDRLLHERPKFRSGLKPAARLIKSAPRDKVNRIVLSPRFLSCAAPESR